MKLHEIGEQLKLGDLTPGLESEKSKDVTAAHVSDLLSDVLAHAPGGGVLVTIQVHMNVLAVAAHAGLAAVIFASGREPEGPVVKKAEEEKIQIYVSAEPAFDVVGQLYGLGLRGSHE